MKKNLPIDDTIVSPHDTAVSRANPRPNPVLARRQARKWSQAELAERAGISRAAVSAIEIERLTPSVTAALALASALECSVEELFGGGHTPAAGGQTWAWEPRAENCRYWEAEVQGRRLLYPVEATGLNATPHDGLWAAGVCRETNPAAPETTLTMASCDPAAGLLAAEYARISGFRLLVFPRGGSAALDMVRQRKVHVAGLHASTTARPERNAERVREVIDAPSRLLRVAEWEEGIALPASNRSRSADSVVKASPHWAARESGSAARECLEELLNGRDFSGRQVDGHPGVAEAVRAGWAEAGVCLRFCAEEAGLNFLPVRSETLDLCFLGTQQNDPRVQALIRLLRSRHYRQLVSELPGYTARETGDIMAV